ncbi:MAG: hypothetical protein F6K54_08060 [Okeania sp. SIO3B5]|uniref:hypothetical protein n=1 Tax=Okeania sp. SIO3B5 TaxID=2607811 RepID=UPI0014019AED|nr:hypothetical protein [Okeania sp. SIO3B5]NEO53040.1 hypothetical protein [Okeania sp. SIO3B5]
MLETNDNKAQLNKSKRDYKIEVVDSEFVLNRWDEIKKILESVFRDSQFNGDSQYGDKYSRNRPVNHTWKNITEPEQEGLKHIIALDLDNNILGAFFVVPCSNPGGVIYYPKAERKTENGQEYLDINISFEKNGEIVDRQNLKLFLMDYDSSQEMFAEAGFEFLNTSPDGEYYMYTKK